MRVLCSTAPSRRRSRPDVAKLVAFSAKARPTGRHSHRRVRRGRPRNPGHCGISVVLTVQNHHLRRREHVQPTTFPDPYAAELVALAVGTVVPQFVCARHRAAAPGKDNILVVVEMTGGNDGLNTVIPYADDLYHKARPTLRQTKDVVIRLDDHVGLNSSMVGFRSMLRKGKLAVGAGRGLPQSRALALRGDGHLAVGRSQAGGHDRLAGPGGQRDEEHFRWSADPAARIERLPAGLDRRPGGGAVTVNDQHSFRLEWGWQDRPAKGAAASCSRTWLRRAASG